MSSILEHLEDLKAGMRVADDCPRCSANQKWWVPGNPEPIGVDPEHDHEGLTCWMTGCGYTVVFGPPDILCSRCGNPLEPAGRSYRCSPCGRTVAP